MLSNYKLDIMEQMNVEESMKVNIDFTAPQLPASAKKLEPLVWKDGDSYCCLLGPDPVEGVFGCGDTLNGAIADWDYHLTKFLATPNDNNEVSKYIRDILKADDTKIR